MKQCPNPTTEHQHPPITRDNVEPACRIKGLPQAIIHSNRDSARFYELRKKSLKFCLNSPFVPPELTLAKSNLLSTQALYRFWGNATYTKENGAFLSPKMQRRGNLSQLADGENAAHWVTAHVGKLEGVRFLDPYYGVIHEDAYLTLLQHCSSLVFLDYYISFTPSHAIPLLCCLHGILSPWSDERRKNLVTEKGWPNCEQIEKLFVPDLAVYHGTLFKSAVSAAKINLIHSYRTLTDSARQVFFDVNQYLSSLADIGKPIVLVDDLQQELARYLIDGINHLYRFDLQDTPMAAYESLMAEFVPVLHRPSFETDFALAIATKSRLLPRGIKFCQLFYNNEKLYFEYLQNLDKIASIKIMPWDLSHIYVATEKRYIRVPALKAAYTQGLSLDRHKAILKAFRRRWQHKDTGPLGRAEDVNHLYRYERMDSSDATLPIG